ncbi:hypothetical protein [Acinetobacter pittii]|uniref:hypothetical protein n=1 Tax=Acinetobacter pittii TaxID=48296 RepID=UPI0024DE9877|nr:hypothetical protein [Acinetobacter pittii]
MFIDLKNGSCINADQVLGATFGEASGSYIVEITLKNNQMSSTSNFHAPKANKIVVKFDEGIQANAYIKKYFGIEYYF